MIAVLSKEELEEIARQMIQATPRLKQDPVVLQKCLLTEFSWKDSAKKTIFMAESSIKTISTASTVARKAKDVAESITLIMKFTEDGSKAIKDIAEFITTLGKEAAPFISWLPYVSYGLRTMSMLLADDPAKRLQDTLNKMKTEIRKEIKETIIQESLKDFHANYSTIVYYLRLLGQEQSSIKSEEAKITESLSKHIPSLVLLCHTMFEKMNVSGSVYLDFPIVFLELASTFFCMSIGLLDWAYDVTGDNIYKMELDFALQKYPELLSKMIDKAVEIRASHAEVGLNYTTVSTDPLMVSYEVLVADKLMNAVVFKKNEQYPYTISHSSEMITKEMKQKINEDICKGVREIYAPLLEVLSKQAEAMKIKYTLS